MASMIRNALLRSPTACLRRVAVAAAEGQLAVSLHPLSTSSAPSYRSLHHLAGGSGWNNLPTAAATAAIANRNASTVKQTQGDKELVEEKTAALLQTLLEREADAATARERKEARQRAWKLILEGDRAPGDMLKTFCSKLDMEAKTEELLTLISRQAASGAAQDQDALLTAMLLARSARSEKAIMELRASNRLMKRGVALAALGALGYYFFH